MKIVTSAEMREIDRITTERFGISSLELMEKAGSAVADFVQKEFSHVEKTLVVCGRGNNGGDGFVAARKLHEAGKQVTVALIANAVDLKGDASVMFSRLPVEALQLATDGQLRDASWEADIIMDALLGTGARLPVEGLYAAAIQKMNDSGVPIVAVDIPSGADADQDSSDGIVVNASAIVTFTALKPAHVFRFYSIPTAVRQIGTPEEAVNSKQDLNLITASDCRAFLSPRKAESNKGMYGHVLVVAGSLGKAGAAAMAGMAALRAGAGLVTVATPKSVIGTVAGFAPELMTEPLPETDTGTVSVLAMEALRKVVAGKSVLAIGPGLSRDRESAQFIRAMVDRSDIPVVLDADGLNAFEEHRQYVTGVRHALVITPHPGEMARLTGLTVAQIQQERVATARDYAKEHQAFVVLKGHQTVIAEPQGRVWINNTGNPGMATGGTGDILTGMIAAMIAQHPQDIAHAVILAVYLHGLAGDVVRDEIGEASLVATDLLTALPEAFRRTTASLTADIL